MLDSPEPISTSGLVLHVLSRTPFHNTVSLEDADSRVRFSRSLRRRSASRSTRALLGRELGDSAQAQYALRGNSMAVPVGAVLWRAVAMHVLTCRKQTLLATPLRRVFNCSAGTELW